MYIQCTKKMLDKMDLQKIKLIPAADDGRAGGFYSWHVNYIQSIGERRLYV